MAGQKHRTPPCMVAGYTLPRGGHLPSRADVDPATVHGGLGDPAVDHGGFDFPAAHHGGVGPDKTARPAPSVTPHAPPRPAPQPQRRTAAAPRPPARRAQRQPSPARAPPTPRARRTPRSAAAARRAPHPLRPPRSASPVLAGGRAWSGPPAPAPSGFAPSSLGRSKACSALEALPPTSAARRLT